MHVGLVLECDYRVGASQEEAFDEALRQAEYAERLGLDSVWLAERHFASHHTAAGGDGGERAAVVPSNASCRGSGQGRSN
jgi:alkanesulfonate monooxygenase SsuD/methylene tetrahydromethanopterin reductase-like flavin-dependent oxidoreductase (luciferase family)